MLTPDIPSSLRNPTFFPFAAVVSTSEARLSVNSGETKAPKARRLGMFVLQRRPTQSNKTTHHGLSFHELKTQNQDQATAKGVGAAWGAGLFAAAPGSPLADTGYLYKIKSP